ncbi:MAG: hypothetical protein ACEQSK_16705 [Sphingomonadaceae bacterium]
MEHNQQRAAFLQELWQRYEALQLWAIEHWPDPAHPLSSADFVATRRELLALGEPRPSARQDAAEPAAGGPQYESLNPTPWP